MCYRRNLLQIQSTRLIFKNIQLAQAYEATELVDDQFHTQKSRLAAVYSICRACTPAKWWFGQIVPKVTAVYCSGNLISARERYIFYKLFCRLNMLRMSYKMRRKQQHSVSIDAVLRTVANAVRVKVVI